MAGKKKEPLAGPAALDVDSGGSVLSGPFRFDPPSPVDAAPLSVTPTALTPDAAVRAAHAALRDAINAARLAGFDVSGNLDRIIISQTGRA